MPGLKRNFEALRGYHLHRRDIHTHTTTSTTKVLQQTAQLKLQLSTNISQVLKLRRVKKFEKVN